MSDEQPNNSSPETKQQQPVGMSFAQFLQTAPASDQFTLVTNALESDDHSKYFLLAAPPLYLHCSSDICEGNRIYRFKDGDRYLRDDPEKTYLTYLCSNCRRMTKMFSLCVQTSGAKAPAALCAKFGEIPQFGTPTPNRLLRLFGSDSRIFLKGRWSRYWGI